MFPLKKLPRTVETELKVPMLGDNLFIALIVEFFRDSGKEFIKGVLSNTNHRYLNLAAPLLYAL
jgi:hypothetical protein